jgi:hypothetical protein
MFDLETSSNLMILFTISMIFHAFFIINFNAFSYNIY